MTIPNLIFTVQALLASGKGILAADESLPTIAKRFDTLSIPCTEENRRAYRELLFTTPFLNEFISGVILFDETLHQKIGAFSMPETLSRSDLIPGIKVDTGTCALAAFPGEKITQGLDGLRERLSAYREQGARFTKWRAVITIDATLPTRACIEANVGALARFAALSQEAGLVPIVEPEVLLDGKHRMERCEAVTSETLEALFAALYAHRVCLEGMLLKTGMVLAGKDCPQQVDVESGAAATLRCLRRCVPAAVPGILFLSGGQKDLAASERLNALCHYGELPWRLSFSYGRALQDEALKIWKGLPENRDAAQSALQHRARCNSLASTGRYSAKVEASHSRAVTTAHDKPPFSITSTLSESNFQPSQL